MNGDGRDDGRAPVAIPGRGGRRVLVIGAGIGGLAAAVRLAHAGYAVTVVERHDAPGGRAGVWRSEGFTFDTGPSMVMMTECWDRLFQDVGRRREDYLTLVRCDPCYRLHFADGSTLEMTSRLKQLLENLERIEPGCGPRALQWLAHTGELYHRGVDFIRRGMHRPQAMLRIGGMGFRYGRAALGDLQAMVRCFFDDERLRQAVTFQALYLGLSPYDALAIYGLLAHAEIAGGIFYPMGGMHQLALALERLGGELGVTHHYGTPVTSLVRVGRRVSAARLADGRELAADLVVANADLPYTYDTLLGEPYPGIERKDFSCSVVLVYLGVNRTYPNLLHHNLAVSRDLAESCRLLCREHRMPDDPPLYVVASTRTDPGQAPPGCENLFVLVLAPSQDPQHPIDWRVEGPRVEERTLDRLEALGCSDLRRHIVTRRLVTPADFTAQFGNLRGEAFGLSHGLRQIGYFRPRNRHSRYRNLYFVGQSTHPGCGLPMVLISAELAAARIARELRAC
ncbi:MAG TPA: phytoene desaturase family protein [Gemmatimonadales bacterium]|nr:phytoene desaturase family protein [Gemmatimonadales bacterium]